MIMVSFLANPDYVGEDFKGLFYGGDAKFLGNQLYGMVVYTAWTVGTSGLMFFGLKVLGWFRVSDEEELEGVDKSHHGGTAYPIDDTHTLALINESSMDGGSDKDDKMSPTGKTEDDMVELTV